MQSSYSPDSSEKYAIDLPSGDHDGSRSATAGLFVRFRISPLSVGTVKISPHASNTARAPVGEMPKFWILLGSTLAKCGRTDARSPSILMLTLWACRVFRS